MEFFISRHILLVKKTAQILEYYYSFHTIIQYTHLSTYKHTHMTQICASRYEGVKLQLVTNTFYMHSFYIYRIYYHIQGDPNKWEILKWWNNTDKWLSIFAEALFVTFDEINFRSHYRVTIWSLQKLLSRYARNKILWCSLVISATGNALLHCTCSNRVIA